MAKLVDCPFCGRRGKRSDEHVWAQWMHKSTGAASLLCETHGERIERQHSRLQRGGGGRYIHDVMQDGRMAKWLPNVKIAVCGACNSGWMSALEEATKNVLGPFIFKSATHLRLSREDLLLLATWATKSWMAYALLRAPSQNPFTTDEYRSMALYQRPLERSQVWLMHSLEPEAHVAMALHSSLISRDEPPPDFESAKDNWAYGLLSVSTVVFALQLLPPESPSGMEDHLAPPMLDSPPVARRIWPNLRPQYFPLGLAPHGTMGALARYPQQLFAAVGLPTIGLTDEDAVEVFRKFREGADPTELRRRWNQTG